MARLSPDFFDTDSVFQDPVTGYYYDTNPTVFITLNNQVIYNESPFSTSIILESVGPSVELIWHNDSSQWYVVGYTFAGFN